MLSRRRWIALAAASLAARSAPARAGDWVVVRAPSAALGAIVQATGPGLVAVKLRPSLAPTVIEIFRREIDVGGDLVLPGDEAARRRFLDDPRGALRLGDAIVRALVEALDVGDTALAAELADHRRAWTRPFARRIRRWSARLAGSPLRGQRLRDLHGRAALLEWAGAIVDPTATEAGPPALAALPAGPRAPTLERYVEYVEALVRRLT